MRRLEFTPERFPQVWAEILLLSLGVLGAGCNGLEDVDGGQAPSAGPFTVDARTVQVARSPSVVVGDQDSLPLDRVRGAVFFGDGIAIANGGSNEVFILDSQGELVTRRGGTGGGPGEYVGLFGIARHDKGLVAWDRTLLRLTRLGPQGEYLSSVRVSPPAGSRSLIGAFGEVALLEARAQGFQGEGSAGPLEIRQDRAFVFVGLSDGAVRFSRSLPGQEQWAAREGGWGIQGGLPILFGGDAVAALAGDRAYLATNDAPTVWAVTERGDETELSFEHAPVPVPPEWIGYARDTLLARFNATEPGELLLADGRNAMMALAEFRRGLLNDLPHRDTLPAFSALLGGHGGSLWMQGYVGPLEDRVLWVSFDELLRPQRRVEMPVSLRVLDIAPDRVLVQTKGPVGEDLVAVYRIVER